MTRSYSALVSEITVYYFLLAICLPFVYAVTYHCSFGSVFNLDWVMNSIVFSPLIFVVATFRYVFSKWRVFSHN